MAFDLRSRYVLPSFVERTNTGDYRTLDPYAKLFEERIIFVGAPVDDVTANDVVAQLLHLESAEPDREIVMYLNSPGGSLTAMTGIYDAMQYVRPEVRTVCLGQVVSAAAILLAGGAAGKRAMLPNSRVVVEQPSLDGAQGQVSDLEIYSAEVTRLRRVMETLLARHTGRPAEEIRRDIDRNLVLPAADAVAYGLADELMPYRKLNAVQR